MKDYAKPCTREDNPDHIIIHVRTNDWSSDNSPERVGKSIVDLAKNLFHHNRKATISGIIPRNDEWNNKAELVNNHLKEMCKFSNIDFIDNSENFNPKKHLNNSKLHLNDKGSYKLSNIVVNYISSIYKWYDINKPFVNINSNDITSNISKFEVLVNGVRCNVDILMISETKIDDSFPLTQFLIEGFTIQHHIG